MDNHDEFSIGLILCKNPQEWSPDEVQAVCQRFIQACDDERTPPDRLLTNRLWRYWFLTHGEEPLMSESKYNMLLMLNAQAFGEFVPPPGNIEFCGRYRQEHAEFEKTLAPPSLIWGPRANMNTLSGPTLESAITHVYVFRTNGQIHEILLIGQSLPELQQEIFQAVFSCALRVQAGKLDMINVDMYRIFSPNSDQNLFELPGITTLSAASIFTQTDDQTVTDALSEFVQQLRLLQKQTRLVAIHEGDISVKQEFDKELRGYAQDAFRNGKVTIVAKESSKSPSMVDLVTLVPYYQIGQRPLPLRVILHPDILDLPSFKDLLTVFTYQTVERICADAKIRQETYEERARQLRQERGRWLNANERMRKEFWGETVLLSERFDEKIGTTIRLAQPTEQSTVSYMENNVPSLITQYEIWAERMRKINHDIGEITVRSDAPIRRLAASRFLDAALRDRGHLIGDATICKYFDRWCSQVAPFLRAKWRTTLSSKGINPDTVFNQHTVFHTHFKAGEHNDIVALVMQPFAMVSPCHSVLIFDPELHFMVARTPSNYTQAFEGDRKNLNSNKLWQRFEHAVKQDSADYENFVNKLRTILSESPFELLPKIVEYFAPSENTGANVQWNEERLLDEQAELVNKIHLITFPSKIVTLLNQQAFQSARKLIKETQVPQNLRVHLVLWQVLVECLAHGQSPIEFIPSLVQGGIQSPWLKTDKGADQVTYLLNQARQYNANFVQEWIDLLANSKNLHPAITLLRRGWIRIEQYLITPQRQVLYKILSAIESVWLAQALESEAQTINSDGESTTFILTKIGQAIEDLLLSEIGVIPFSDILALLETLIGEERALGEAN